METSSAQQLKDNVKRVLRFKNLEESHVVWVGQMSHDLDLFDQALFSFLLTIICFFRKSFNSISVLVLMLFYQID